MPIYLFISILLSAFPAAHDFKMSVCEINYVTDKAFFEVRFYIFQDDLKEALYGDPQSDKMEEGSVVNYILEKVKIQSDGLPVPLTFSEMKEREDQIKVVFHTAKIKGGTISNLLVSNQLLLEKFKNQTNMVYVTLPGQTKKTKILNADKTEGTFEF